MPGLLFKAISSSVRVCASVILVRKSQQQHSCSSIVVSPVLQEMDNFWIIV